MRHHLADGAVSSGKLAPGSVMGHHLAEGSVLSRHIVQDAITSEHLTARCVTTEALADQSVTGEKIADGSIGPEKLNFPILPQSFMQCGTSTFSIAESERETEVVIPLNFPFAHGNYVVVAMTDRSGCRPLLRERKVESFILVVQKDGAINSRVEGTVFWIGMGYHGPNTDELKPGENKSVSLTEEEQKHASKQVQAGEQEQKQEQDPEQLPELNHESEEELEPETETEQALKLEQEQGQEPEQEPEPGLEHESELKQGPEQEPEQELKPKQEQNQKQERDQDQDPDVSQLNPEELAETTEEACSEQEVVSIQLIEPAGDDGNEEN